MVSFLLVSLKATNKWVPTPKRHTHIDCISEGEFMLPPKWYPIQSNKSAARDTYKAGLKNQNMHLKQGQPHINKQGEPKIVFLLLVFL